MGPFPGKQLWRLTQLSGKAHRMARGQHKGIVTTSYAPLLSGIGVERQSLRPRLVQGAIRRPRGAVR
jgi:hypothetical protein